MNTNWILYRYPYTTHILHEYKYIYILNVNIMYIELGYDALQSTRALCALRSIINFKLEIIDPKYSI
jgi:hypothetical protein